MKNFEVYIEDRFEDSSLELLIDSKKLKIFLNKGTSFGSSHDTTVLTIEAIKYVYQKKGPVANCLDLGSGSGILSILLSKLNYLNIYACEIDLHAIDESVLNFKSNLKNDYPKFIKEPFCRNDFYNLIVSNISGGYIPNNIINFSHSLKKDGFLILSGFNSEKQIQITNVSLENNLKFVQSFHNKPWISMIFQKS